MDLFWIQWPILGSSGHFWRDHGDDFDSHVTRKWHHLVKMIDFGQYQIIGEKIHYSKYYDVIISSCVRNYEYLIGDSNVDTDESIPTKKKKSWMHTNPNICHLWHTSNRCTILDINLYSGYPRKSKQIQISHKLTTQNRNFWDTAKSS